MRLEKEVTEEWPNGRPVEQIGSFCTPSRSSGFMERGCCSKGVLTWLCVFAFVCGNKQTMQVIEGLDVSCSRDFNRSSSGALAFANGSIHGASVCTRQRTALWRLGVFCK